MTEDRDLQFEQLLEEQNQAFVEAKPFNDWMPPPGTYTMTLSDVKGGTFTDKKTDDKFVYVRPVFKIAYSPDPTLNGKECEPFFSMKVPGIFKTFVQGIAGEELPEGFGLKAAWDLLKSNVGGVYSVESTKSKDGFYNLTIQSKVPSQPEAAEAPAEPQPEPEPEPASS
jgi:hypothetical protein